MDGSIIRRLWHRIPSGILVAAVAFIAAELTARVDDRIRDGTPLVAAPNEEYDLFVIDSLGRRGRPYGHYKKWRLNRFGFRNAEMSVIPRPECTRLMVLGASESFGLYESPGKEYPAQLQDMLSRYGCFEVINAAIPGSTLPAITQFWNGWGVRFRPQIVVVYPTPAFYLEDQPPRYRKLPDTTAAPPSSARAWLHSRALDRARDALSPSIKRIIRRWQLAWTVRREEASHPPGWIFHEVPNDRLKLFIRHLDSLVTAVQAAGAEPILVTHAMYFHVPTRSDERAMLDDWRRFSPRATGSTVLAFEQAAARAVIALGARRGIPVVDVASVMNGRHALFADFVHFSDSGATVIAELIGKRILESRPPVLPAQALSGHTTPTTAVGPPAAR